MVVRVQMCCIVVFCWGSVGVRLAWVCGEEWGNAERRFYLSWVWRGGIEGRGFEAEYHR
jgi:hypothetical protein